MLEDQLSREKSFSLRSWSQHQSRFKGYVCTLRLLFSPLLCWEAAASFLRQSLHSQLNFTQSSFWHHLWINRAGLRQQPISSIELKTAAKTIRKAGLSILLKFIQKVGNPAKSNAKFNIIFKKEIGKYDLPIMATILTCRSHNLGGFQLPEQSRIYMCRQIRCQGEYEAKAEEGGGRD